MRRNHYEVLGIPPSASRADIKKAYIEKAKKVRKYLNVLKIIIRSLNILRCTQSIGIIKQCFVRLII